MTDNFGDKKNTNGFDKNPKNIGGGRPKGVKNRATILKEILALDDNEYKVNEAMIKLAMGGNVNAFKEIMDSIYGKNPEKIEDVTPTKEPDLSKLSEKELKQYEKLNKKLDSNK